MDRSRALPDEILTVAESYAADTFAAEHGVAAATLMENAGRAVAEEIARRWPAGTAYVVCGPGNNGGDAFVAARHLRNANWSVRLALVSERGRLRGEAATMADRWDGGIEALSS